MVQKFVSCFENFSGLGSVEKKKRTFSVEFWLVSLSKNLPDFDGFAISCLT
ncbi:hypothetical protein LEP1GSC060_3212 [Leptospira weilii serovar Ranarum str. ICFT]|uniref:Uncharacterized protein n=1 Tax=Leptospira weilii serovar Ranarum str. ICFT TaxID=1218598 RepID=N1WIR7_9LEPT|nr:hypothetical protein LEP1GSC060_3212 [Leptospira weilii serovar Ranarum str. ICFT]